MPTAYVPFSAARRLGRALAGVVLAVAVSGCAAPSPLVSASVAPESSGPSPTAEGSSAPTAAPGWTAAASPRDQRIFHTATRLRNGKVLVAGGGIDPALASAELYDPDAGTWAATGSMQVARLRHQATLLDDGRVLVTGGTDSVIDGGRVSDSAELYDPVTGVWEQTQNMSTPRVHHTATLLADGKVLVVGGMDGTGNWLASAEMFDPQTEAWTAVAGMATPRWYHSATLVPGGRVLVAGGINGADTPLASVELFDPATRSWIRAGALGVGRSGQLATLLDDGTVLLVGGGYPNPMLASAERYDPVSGSSTATGPLGVGRWGESTATLLLDGQVLVVGGYRALVQDQALASGELYDPIVGSWTSAGEMTEARHGHTATLLDDGRVLVVGGGFFTLTAAELFSQ